jgi:hypothetical protein
MLRRATELQKVPVEGGQQIGILETETARSIIDGAITRGILIAVKVLRIARLDRECLLQKA